MPERKRVRLLGWSAVLLLLTVAAIVLLSFELTAITLVLVWVGIPVALALLPLVRNYADLHRIWAARHLDIKIPRPYLPVPDGGMLVKAKAAATDPATWRDLTWLFVNATAGLALCATNIALFFGALGYITLFAWWDYLPDEAELPVIGLFTIHDTPTAAMYGITYGVLLLALWWWLSPRVMRWYGLLARWLLAPNERSRLANRVRELTESRADTVDTQAAELRRIERDLHDGAQARLVALGMSLGMAEEIVAKNPQAAVELLAEARETSGMALAELRNLVRGIHPPVLADRGLEGALRALVLANSMPIALEVDLPGRLPAPVESAAYFAVAESLTNVVKHSGADKAWVRIDHADGRLNMLVGDNGRGGADPQGGTGLRGIERRLSAFDGVLLVTSPPGGPTVVAMNLPCEFVGPSAGSSR